MRYTGLLILSSVVMMLGTTMANAELVAHFDPNDPADLYNNTSATTPITAPYEGKTAYAIKDSGTGRWMQQGGATVAPTVAVGATAATPWVLRFNGGQNLLHYDNGSGNQGFPDNFLSTDQLTVILAGKVDSLETGVGNFFGFNGDSPTPADYFGLKYDHATDQLIAYTTYGNVATGVSEDQWFVAEIKWNGTDLSLAVNGQSAQSTTLTQSLSPVNYQRFRLGATASTGNAMSGYLGDFYLYKQHTGDTSDVIADLMGDYGVVPEPSTFVLLGVGALVGLFVWRRKRA